MKQSDNYEYEIENCNNLFHLLKNSKIIDLSEIDNKSNDKLTSNLLIETNYEPIKENSDLLK